MLIGSVSGMACPDIPSPPYIPESPQEDIIKVEAYIEQYPSPSTSKTMPVAESLRLITVGPTLHLTVTFAAETPPAGHEIIILVTILEGTPPKESILGCASFSDPASTAYKLDVSLVTAPVDGGSPNIAVYAWLEGSHTDRAPNDGFYPITSISSANPNVFQDYEPAPVGGVIVPKNSLEILTPYIALASRHSYFFFIIVLVESISS
jgi:hypothetical protein